MYFNYNLSNNSLNFSKFEPTSDLKTINLLFFYIVISTYKYINFRLKSFCIN